MMTEKHEDKQGAQDPTRRRFLMGVGLAALGRPLVMAAASRSGEGSARQGAASLDGTFSGLDERLWKTTTRSGEKITWRQVSPGHGGTCFYLRIHPADPNCEVESCDMGGTYVTQDGSRTYQTVNDPDVAFPRLHYLNGVDFCLARPQVGYAVSDANGAFKTTDKGRTWTPLNTEVLDALYAGARRERAPLSTVTVDPENPDDVWLGTGFRRGDEIRETLRSPCGMGHSSDGGRTWTHVTHAFPPGAMLRKLCITPADSPVGKVLLAATDRGLYLSRDGGMSWIKRGGAPGRGLPHDQLRDLDVCWDRKRERLVIAVALNTEVSAAGEGLEFRGGIFRSEDLGETWEDATGNLRLPLALIRKMPEFAPVRNTSPAYPIIQRLLWRDFLADPANRAALASMGSDSDRSLFERWTLFRRKHQSEVRRDALKRIDQSAHLLPPFNEVRLDPRDPQVIYTSIFEMWYPFGVWKTRDGGQTWINTVRGAQGWSDPDWAAYRPAEGPVFNVEQVWTGKHPMNWGAPLAKFGMWDVRTFDLCKANPDVLYFHTHRVTYRSDDGGANWRDACNHLVPDSDGGFMGNGNSNMCVYGLAFDPKGSEKTIFWMADCGVKTSPDGGRSVKSMPGANFGSNQWVYSAAFDPDDPDRFYQIFGCHDGLTDLRGTYFLETRDFGRTCEGVTVAPDGGVVAPAKLTTFTETVNRLLVDPRSPRERRRFIAAHSVVSRFAFDEASREQGSQGVFVSEDGGKSWEARNRGLEGATLNILELAPDPRNFDVLYAAMVMRLDDTRVVPGGLYVSRDGAASWSKIDSLPLINVSQVVALPDGTLYAAGGFAVTGRGVVDPGGIYRSTDGGRHWEQILAVPRVSCMAVCPTNPKLLFCTVDSRRQLRTVEGIGIWRSSDGGKRWARVNRGLAANFRFTCMEFNPNVKGEIWVGTCNTGYYRAIDPEA